MTPTQAIAASVGVRLNKQRANELEWEYKYHYNNAAGNGRSFPSFRPWLILRIKDMPRTKLPDHIPYTNREWKQLKRAELKAVRRALNTLMLGVAFTPAYDRAVGETFFASPFEQADKALKELERRFSFKTWGR
jgi:hypothetical protein